MSADLQAIKLRVERSLPPDVVADLREAGIILMLEAANGSSRPLVDNTIFISTKIGVRHAPRIKLAIDPPDSFSPGSVTASIAIDSGEVVAGEEPAAKVLKQVQRFIDLNRDLLLEYRHCRISTAEFGRRAKSISASPSSP